MDVGIQAHIRAGKIDALAESGQCGVNTSHPSTMNKVVEYRAVGKPIVQFETTEGRFSARGAALCARPNEACELAARILEPLDDAARRRAMGALGLERVRTELAWTHQAATLLAAYDAAFGARS